MIAEVAPTAVRTGEPLAASDPTPARDRLYAYAMGLTGNNRALVDAMLEGLSSDNLGRVAKDRGIPDSTLRRRVTALREGARELGIEPAGHTRRRRAG